jgi:hypothetical protein
MFKGYQLGRILELSPVVVAGIPTGPQVSPFRRADVLYWGEKAVSAPLSSRPPAG